jgi:hypothetical protein
MITFSAVGSLLHEEFKYRVSRDGDAIIQVCRRNSRLIVRRELIFADLRVRPKQFRAEGTFGSGLQSVLIPRQLEVIGKSCFSGCKFLTTVRFESNSTLKVIEEAAFLESATRSICIPRSVQTIGRACFRDCSQLRFADFECNSCLRKLDDHTFEGTRLELICIPQRVEAIGKLCFASCDHLIGVSFAADSVLTIIDEFAFANDNLLCDICLPETVERIDPSSFRQLRTLTFRGTGRFLLVNQLLVDPATDRLVLPLGTLRSICVPDTVKVLGASAFSGLEMLVEVKFVGRPEVREIESHCFSFSGLESIVIPQSVEQLGDSCFSGCSGLVKVAFKWNSRVKRIPSYAFRLCPLPSICIPKNVEVIEDCGFLSCAALELITFERSSSLRELCGFASAGLQQIVIPATVEVIHQFCFRDCRSLFLVEFAKGSKLRKIKKCAFLGTALTSLAVPSSCVSLSRLDASCLEIATFEDESNLRRIKGAFGGTRLPTIEVPKSVEFIGPGSFQGCHRLETTIFEENSVLRELGSRVFAQSILLMIFIPEFVEVIGDSCFEDCCKLAAVTFHENSRLKELGKRTFAFSG